MSSSQASSRNIPYSQQGQERNVGSQTDSPKLTSLLKQPSHNVSAMAVSKSFTGLALLLLSVIAAYIAAILVMMGVFFWPQNDPLDVVGVSLLMGFNGYSEAAERNAFYAFVASLCVFGPLANLILLRLPSAKVQAFGVVTLWLLLAIFCRGALLVGMLELAWVLSILTLLGQIGIASRLGRGEGAFPGWTVVICAWGAYQHFCHQKFATPPTLIEAMIVPWVVTMAVYRHFFPFLFSKSFPWISIASALTLIALSEEGSYSRGIAVAGCSLVYSNPQTAWSIAKRVTHDGIRGTIAERINVWAIVGLLAWIISWIPTVNFGFIRIAVEAVLIGMLIQMGRIPACAYLREHGWMSLIQDIPRSTPTRLVQERTAKWLVPVVILSAGYLSGWFATRSIAGWVSIGLAGFCMSIAWHLRQSLPGPIRGWILAIGLAIACWPSSPIFPLPERSQLDEFHTGQIMSAIWEIEQGRPFITEVFPLRSTEVVLGWICRRLFGQSTVAVFCPHQLRSPLLAAGACLMSYAWTRSAFWSVLTGLSILIIPGSRFETHSLIREGIFLVVLGTAMEILRCPNSRWWLLLAPIGVIPLTAGFDVGVPYLAAIGAATLCGHNRRFHLFDFVRGGLWAIAIVSLSVGTFSAVLAATAGMNAAIDYWSILLDFSKHYPAFYGLPIGIQWVQDGFIFNSLLGLGSFAAGGAILWTRMSSRIRRQWALLLIGEVMFAHRGLGRSDTGHLYAAVLPIIVIWMVIAFEMLRRISRERSLFTANQFQLLAPCAIIILILQSSNRGANFLEFAGKLRHMPAGERLLREPDPVITGLVKSDEFLWPVDNGIANIEQQRHNPTRHAIAYCIGSPKEQRRAVQDIKSHPTPLILWRWAFFDTVDGLLRHRILSNYVLKNYRPISGGQRLYGDPCVIPAEPEWTGCDDGTLASFVNESHFRRLPSIWGERLWPQLAPRMTTTRDYAPWTSMASVSDHEPQSNFLATEDIVPREWNFVLLEFASHQIESNAVDWPTVRLEFAEGETFSKLSGITWECRPDGKAHRYLVPVGTRPCWMWKSHIRKLRLSSERGRITLFRPALLAEIDELRDFD